MNNLFDEYIESLTHAKKIVAREAVATYLKGESAKVEQIRSAAEINAKMRYFANYEDEHAAAILMNQAGKIIKVKELSHGSLTGTLVDVRIIAKEAILSNATSVALVHNHPSGSLQPSKDDDSLTRRVREGLQTLQIRLIDHVIISNEGYYSYSDNDRI